MAFPPQGSSPAQRCAAAGWTADAAPAGPPPAPCIPHQSQVGSQRLQYDSSNMLLMKGQYQIQPEHSWHLLLGCELATHILIARKIGIVLNHHSHELGLFQ